MCAFGRYNYGDESRGESPEYTAFVPALRNLGHEVILFDSWNRLAYPDLASLNIALLHAVDDFCPDIFLSVQINYEIWLETIEKIKSRGDLITITWATDDSWKYKEVSRFIASSYDRIITTYPHLIHQYKADGIDSVHSSQWAATSDFLQEPLLSKNCKYNVSFIGTKNKLREHWIRSLTARGINVNCFGFGWPSGSVPSKEIPRIIRESRICLNFAASRGENQIKARIFEVPGAGGFLLTDSARSLDKYYKQGKEICVFSDFEDLVYKINYYLENPDERNMIAQAGFLRTRLEHTYENRFIEIIPSFESIPKAPTILDSSSDFEEIVAKHKLSPTLRIVRNILQYFFIFLLGKPRGVRAARRLVYECSWRLFGRHTFTASGWPGRMFPHD